MPLIACAVELVNRNRSALPLTRHETVGQIAIGLIVKPHLNGRLFCNAIRRFLPRKNLSRRVVTHTRQDSLAAIAFDQNRRRVSNTSDLRCRLYFARLDAKIILARDHLNEVDFNVSRVPGQSRAHVNSKSYEIYESPRQGHI